MLEFHSERSREGMVDNLVKSFAGKKHETFINQANAHLVAYFVKEAAFGLKRGIGFVSLEAGKGAPDAIEFHPRINAAAARPDKTGQVRARHNRQHDFGKKRPLEEIAARCGAAAG